MEQDTISELEAVTAEMAELQDLGSKRLSDLLERRGTLIRRLIGSRFDGGDSRLASIIAHADHLQERLQKRSASLRGDLSSLDATRALMGAVRSTINKPRPGGVDISA
jgi:hypothetical protein